MSPMEDSPNEGEPAIGLGSVACRLKLERNKVNRCLPGRALEAIIGRLTSKRRSNVRGTFRTEA